MKRIIDDAALPEPVSLTPEQLAAVATDTSAMLGAGGGMIMIYGGDLLRQVSMTSSINVATISAPSINAASLGAKTAGVM